MKQNSMKSMVFFVMTTLATTIAMSAGTAWAHAGGDGSGFSGPNLAPDSIPLHLDRGILAKDVGAAIGVCFATGDAQRGIVSVMQKLEVQIAQGRVDVSQWRHSFSVFTFNDQRAVMIQATGTGASTNASNDNFYLSSGHYQNQANFNFYPRFDQRQSEVSLLYPGPQGFPSVHFESSAQDSGVDEYGRVDNNFLLLLNVSIKLPTEYGTAVRLVNTATNRPTQLTVNAQEYVECLKGEIQRRAQ